MIWAETQNKDACEWDQWATDNGLDAMWLDYMGWSMNDLNDWLTYQNQVNGKYDAASDEFIC